MPYLYYMGILTRILDNSTDDLPAALAICREIDEMERGAGIGKSVAAEALMKIEHQLVGVPTNGLAGEHGEGAAVLAG
eukprot:COSAG01_NODE_12_length_41732_cov_160.472964_14_plen_78_part_00